MPMMIRRGAPIMLPPLASIESISGDDNDRAHAADSPSRGYVRRLCGPSGRRRHIDRLLEVVYQSADPNEEREASSASRSEFTCRVSRRSSCRERRAHAVGPWQRARKPCEGGIADYDGYGYAAPGISVHGGQPHAKSVRSRDPRRAHHALQDGRRQVREWRRRVAGRPPEWAAVDAWIGSSRFGGDTPHPMGGASEEYARPRGERNSAAAGPAATVGSG